MRIKSIGSTRSFKNLEGNNSQNERVFKNWEWFNVSIAVSMKPTSMDIILTHKRYKLALLVLLVRYKLLNFYLFIYGHKLMLNFNLE